MNYSGILVGAAVFLSIGICHPLVIKMEYQWGKQSWWVWLVAGLAFCTLSLLVQNDILSIIIGGFAFCCLWGIHEMFLLLLPLGHPRDVPPGKARAPRLVPGEPEAARLLRGKTQGTGN